MRLSQLIYLTGLLIIISTIYACKHKPDKKTVAPHHVIFKGLYSLSPTVKLFKACATGHEYFVADSSKELELKYWQLVPAEKADEPLYIEAEGEIVKSNTNDNGGHDTEDGYDSTLVVKKLITITKDIPAGKCN